MNAVRGIALVIVGIAIVLGILLANAFRDKRPPLFFAAAKGDTNYLSRYLRSGGNVNASVLDYPYGGSNTSPLVHIAIAAGQLDTVVFLLANGADPNLLDREGRSPLLKSVYSDAGTVRTDVLKVLLKAGANPNLTNSGNYRVAPLSAAASSGRSEAVRVLLSAGADINGTNTDGLTALHFAANAEIARLLIEAGADPGAHAGGETPAETALRLGNVDALSVLTNSALHNKGVIRGSN